MDIKRILKTALCTFLVAGAVAHAEAEKPNILVIWGDDVGIWDLSAYHRGMMGSRTPNIDRIADNGMIFMDHLAHASCTAGRAAFITGQYPMRTGLSTVGLPGAPQGLQKEDPTLAVFLKDMGYATGQFGKNHLGDRDEHLPTAHGFDEFFGILYHLNAGEYAEQDDYPTDPEILERYEMNKMRGVIHSRRLADGTHEVKDLGTFGQERQRVLEQEILTESTRFIRDAVAAGEPFFVWHNSTRMHYRTNLSPEYEGKTGLGVYADGLAELDDVVGALLDLLEELGVDENTIVMFSSDNGAAANSWPDGGNTPFRGEKGAGGYEGGFRVPMVVKWEDRIPEGVATGEFMIMEDWLPTLMSFLGLPNLKEELLEGKQVGDETYRVHLDGYDQSDLVLNQGASKRKEYYYFTETTFHGLRYHPWKLMYTQQESWFHATQDVLSSPYITNIKLDPFERFHEARGYDEWQENRAWLFAPAIMQLESFVKSFEEFPPRQPSFSPKVDDLNAVIQSMRKLPGNR